MRSALFLALAPHTWGEAALGLEVAHGLHRLGRRVVFLAPRGLAPLFTGVPFKVGVLDGGPDLVEVLCRIIADERAAALFLADVTSVYGSLRHLGLDETFAARVPVPVIGLDAWDTRRSGRAWDVAFGEVPLSPHAAAVTRRMVPVPIADPATDSAYDALPVDLPDAAARAGARARLGLGDARLLVVTTAGWQHPKILSLGPAPARLAALLPFLVARYLERLPGQVRLVHIGPQPLRDLEALGPGRYTWVASPPQPAYRTLLACADLYLSFNLSGTSMGLALAAEVPIVAVTGAHAGSADAILAAVPGASPELAAGVRAAAPMFPFQVWPIGLEAFLAPLLRDNPFVPAFARVDLLDERGFVATLAALLLDEDVRQTALARQRAYVERVRALPSGAALAARYVDGDAPAQAFRRPSR